MDDFLKKTINYFNAGSIDDDFVGQVVEVGAMKLRIVRKIAEGGFAIVYIAKDIQNGNEYALKRLFGSDKDECNNIIKEINIHKQVSGHANIVQFLTASFIDRTKNSGRAEYLLVTELCKGGSLYDCLDQTLEPQIVLKIIYQATKAIAHLHSQGINHRDIKIENFLIGTDGILKLCDFGSATKESHEPDITWTTQQRNNLEEFLQKFTTPMYRAPEQLDTWNNYPIGIKTDVWALGCILFCLCYKKHPFEDGAKLRIINGNYTIPNDSRFVCFNDIIKGCFMVDPTVRFDITTVLERLGAISETKGWPLKGEMGIKGKPLTTSPVIDAAPNVSTNNGNSPAHHNAPSRPPPPRPNSNPVTSQSRPEMRQPPPVPQHPQQQQQQQQQQQAGSGLFSSIKGGAGSFLKNLKDTSSKVMQQVQQTMTKADMDLSFITQRIIVMPCPSEGLESAYKINHIDDVKIFVDQRYQPSKVSVYNLGPRCARLAPPVRTVECGFIYAPNPPKAPILSHMYALAEDMYGFLNIDPKHVIIIQSPDNGKGTAATMVCALMLYAQLIREPEDAMQMFAVKRIPPCMKPSELRYSYYMADVIRSHFPHYKPITLVSINFSPIPRMTKARDGCRLFIEVTANDRVAISTLQEYDRMRMYHVSEGKVNLPLNITLCGDITVTLYHARNTIVGMGKPQGLKICQLQFHSGFIPEEETLLSFNRAELDEIPDAEHVPNNFNLSLSVFVGDDERAPVSQPPWLSQQQTRQRDPKILFSSQLEYEENVDNFITKPSSNNNSSSNLSHVPPPRPPAPAPKRPDPPIFNAHEFKDESESLDGEEKTEPPVAEFDFLNLNNEKPPVPEPPKQIPKVKEPSFDLLGGFDSNFSDPFPDLVGSALNKPTTTATEPVLLASNSSSHLDDIFGSLPQAAAIPTIVPSKSSNDLNTLNMNFGSASNAKSQEDVKRQDPFADLTQSMHPEFNSFSKSSQNLHTASASTNASPRNNPSTPIHQTKSPMNNEATQRPDYSRSHFQEPSQVQGASSSQKKSADIFGDILGQQGYSFGKTHQGPKSINEMRKVELAQTMDPEKLKVSEWTEGKRGNIRALICSVHTILWTDAKWSKCEMSSLMSANDVKKAYRRCCLAVHPDKHTGTENENMAKLIFMELNNAFSEFENDASKQNLF